MTVVAHTERIKTPPELAEKMYPTTQLSPIQMAYQLLHAGHNLAAVKEMIAFGKEMEADAAEKAFNDAMAAAQREMGVVATNMENTQTKSKYADYAQLDKALRPIYTKYGFSLSFNDGEGAPDGWVRIVCHVSNSGHTRTYHKDMPADGTSGRGNDAMSKTHAIGAAQSYAMRYLLRMIFNVAVGEGDTDGNAPETSPLLTKSQMADLRSLIEKFGADSKKLCQRLKVQRLDDLPQARLAEAVAMIQSKGRQP